MKYNPYDILKNIESWTAKWLGQDFKFRQYQKETVLRTLINILNERTGNTIISAPTGSGKSITALIIAGVLSEYYNMSSYLCVSDTYLHDQYEQAINRYKLPFGNIKGQEGNYDCDKIHEDAAYADCKLKNISFKKLMDDKWISKNPEYKCAKTCKWILDRKKALNASVTVLTYQFWMYQLHAVPDSPFTERDVVIYDECHKIPEIVQSLCTVKFSENDINLLCNIYNIGKLNEYNQDLLKKACAKKELSCPKFDLSKPSPDFRDELKELFKSLQSAQYEGKMYEDLKTLYKDYIETCIGIKIICDYNIEIAMAREETLTKDDWKNLRDLQWIIHFATKFEWLFNIIDKSSMKLNGLIREINTYSIQSMTLNDMLFSQKEDFTELSFCCIDEAWLIWDKLLSHRKSHNVMMSATVGNIETYTSNIGLSYERDYDNGKYDYIQVKSIFDFSKSPINFLSLYKMNYKEKDTSLKKLFPYIQMICNNHKGQRGIIHTGSYDITRKLIDWIPYPEVKERLSYYDNSKEKKNLIREISMKDDQIIVGPSMIEGVDLPDDLCRFMIILKVPFPSLASEYIKAKMKYIPTWYQAQTINQIIQCIGRGVRNEKDWCTTYILDGCFKNILTDTVKQDINIKDRLHIFNF